MVTHQPKDGHPPEKSALQTWNLVLRLKLTKLTPGDNCHGWSPTNPMMVTHQKEVCYKLGIWHIIQEEGGGVKTIMDFFYNEKCNQDKNSQNRWKMMEFDTEELILVFVKYAI